MIDRLTLNVIGNFILKGMSEKEACILADSSYHELQGLKENSEDIRTFIEKKHVEFKYNHIKEIQTKKSEKNSIWLLEKLVPDMNPKRNPASSPTTVNIISNIIKEIQTHDTGIVRNSRGERIEHNEDDEQPGYQRGASLLG